MIAYLTNTIYPSKSANFVHVKEMQQAFSDLQINHTVFAIKGKSFKSQNGTVGLLYIPIPLYTLFYGIVVNLLIKSKGFLQVYSRSFVGTYFSTFYGSRINVLELHTASWNNSRLHQFMATRIFKKVNIFVCITQSLAEDLKKKVSRENVRITVLPDAAQENECSEAYTLQGKPGNLKIGYLGGSSEGKGFEILQPLSNLIKANMELHIASSGYDKTLFNSSQTFHYGYLNRTEIKKFLNSLDVCLLPNQNIVKSGRNDYGKYTSPLKMFEYMAAGKVIIASDIKVLKEVLDSSNSILVSDKDVNEWLLALESLRVNPDRMKSIGTKAKNDFLQKYTWKIRANNIAKLFKQ